MFLIEAVLILVGGYTVLKVAFSMGRKRGHNEVKTKENKNDE